jgi:hypothetical protein
MSQKRYKPAKDGDFIAWAENIYSRCKANAVLWGLNQDTIDTLSTLVPGARSAYDTNNNRELANHQTAAYKDSSFKALDAVLTPFVNVLEGTLTVPDADIVAMNLRPRTYHSSQPKPVPTSAPFLSVINNAPGEIKAYVTIEQHGHPLSSLSDMGYGGFVFRYHVEDESEWHEVLSTSLQVTVNFDEEQRGKHVNCLAAWFNPRLERGPHSIEVIVIVS